ncbi:MAG TPA: phytanoyl-CoA dioxygenase family protein [Sphingobium sp.]|uniref:phytanoyl-CoA dioxygenase family protein n=1 Tax=Sphingobium sp. TaxID=1912891 RepID=UPI002ED3CD55
MVRGFPNHALFLRGGHVVALRPAQDLLALSDMHLSPAFYRDLLPGVPLVESPFFSQAVEEMDLSPLEHDIAVQLHERGYAVLDFPDPLIGERMDRIRQRLGPYFGIDFADPAAIKNAAGTRLQDAWFYDEDVRAIAANADVLALLSKLYGRQAFPFQTLNFPVGTQQAAHSDSVHFSSLPERFMCGVWLAFEDIDVDAGPLLYYPASHKWPVASNAMLGREGGGRQAQSAQAPFEPYWGAMIAATGCEKEVFLARKGQALIWSANLLHGGSLQNDPTLTRWSQVTHYYFKDCVYYTPTFSDEPLGRLDIRTITNIATGNVEPSRYLGTMIEAQAPEEDMEQAGWFQRRRSRREQRDLLPDDFNAEVYYRLNPDVALSGVDAGKHYLKHGVAEGRRYRF